MVDPGGVVLDSTGERFVRSNIGVEGDRIAALASPTPATAPHADVPEVEADFVLDYEPDDPSGIKGVGEIGTVGTAAAMANAEWHATGTRHRTHPVRLDRVVEEHPSS